MEKNADIAAAASGPGTVRLGAIRGDPLVRRAVKVGLDAALAGLALWTASLLLRRGAPDLACWTSFVVLAMAVNVGFRFHSQHYRMVGMSEAEALLVGNLCLAAAAMVLCFVHRGRWPSLEPPGVVLGGSLLTGPLWFGLRMLCVARHRRRYRRDRAALPPSPRKRTLIIGAGGAGTLLCQELLEHPARPWEVVGFVDDALEKQGVRIHGIPVLGPTRLLPVYLREQRAAQVILCLPGAPGSRLRELAETVRAEGVEVKTVPGITDLIGDRPWKPEVRDLAIEDLLQREPVTLDTAAIRAAVGGAVVLITGGGGSIGSELARRVADLRPARLVLLGRGENSLWLAQRELANLFPGLSLEIVLCDIRNRVRLAQAFEAWRPEVVLHAAAHKHVPFLEAHPEEAVENNVFGTRNVVDLALEWGTRTLVNVSTDKAVNPASVLGVSKRIGELVLARAAAGAGPGVRLVSVRFGNVLGSRGSVIPVFKEQIRRGGPVTVTHPDMVRFFMTIPEAAQLVLQAGLLGDSGKVFALDMGDPVRIVDLAREVVRLSGYIPGVDMEIRFTGVRPGEKLCEDLFNPGEARRTQVHAKVLEAVQDPLDPAVLAQGLRTLEHIIRHPGRGRRQELLECFLGLVPSYRPSPGGLGRLGAEPAGPREAGPREPSTRPDAARPIPAMDGGLSAIA
ncbi:MAG: nucleoside-diphosphate sugar epimerase/dehydratase [Holophaga sp.]|jgi:FlaA1/EpsC-like NDP-sugar epimerase